jgi:hypothetical protein
MQNGRNADASTPVRWQRRGLVGNFRGVRFMSRHQIRRRRASRIDSRLAILHLGEIQRHADAVGLVEKVLRIAGSSTMLSRNITFLDCRRWRTSSTSVAARAIGRGGRCPRISSLAAQADRVPDVTPFPVRTSMVGVPAERRRDRAGANHQPDRSGNGSAEPTGAPLA